MGKNLVHIWCAISIDRGPALDKRKSNRSRQQGPTHLFSFLLTVAMRLEVSALIVLQWLAAIWSSYLNKPVLLSVACVWNVIHSIRYETRTNGQLLDELSGLSVMRLHYERGMEDLHKLTTLCGPSLHDRWLEYRRVSELVSHNCLYHTL